jgi:hypothetical protein
VLTREERRYDQQEDQFSASKEGAREDLFVEAVWSSLRGNPPAVCIVEKAAGV